MLLSLHQESCPRSRVVLTGAGHTGNRVAWTPCILVPFKKQRSGRKGTRVTPNQARQMWEAPFPGLGFLLS